MKKAKILIVEDEAIIAMEMENQLQGLGYEVTSIVDTGEKAIKKTNQISCWWTFGLILWGQTLNCELKYFSFLCNLTLLLSWFWKWVTILLTAEYDKLNLSPIFRLLNSCWLFKQYTTKSLFCFISLVVWQVILICSKLQSRILKDCFINSSISISLWRRLY